MNLKNPFWTAGPLEGKAYIERDADQRIRKELSENQRYVFLFDDAHRATIEEVAWQHGTRIVACGHVTMHVRSRKPLQDTMTAIRAGKPVAQCGYQLAPNAEQHLRSRVRLANMAAFYG